MAQSWLEYSRLLGLSALSACFSGGFNEFSDRESQKSANLC